MRRLTFLMLAACLAIGAGACSGEDGKQGPPGEPGERGPAGADGKDGKDGKDGADGRDGVDGEDGEPGEQGPAGPQGEQGPRGFTGTEGRTEWDDYIIAGGQGRTIVTRGGNGTDGAGGDGHYVEVYNYSARSEIAVLNSGTPNTAFTVPRYAPNLGSNPKTIQSSMRLSLAATPTPNRVVAGISTILGDDDTNPATGLYVPEGVTLTLVANIDTDNADGDGDPATGTFELARLAFSDGVLIEGTIVLDNMDGSTQGDRAGLHTANLDLDCGVFVSRPGSVINASGDDRTTGDGGNAGFVDIHTNDSDSGAIVMGAAIRAVGGSGDNGGNGGDVILSGVYGTLYILGGIDASGGVGEDGLGGNGGDLTLNADSDTSGGNYISGDVISRGGDGTDGGGDGGDIDIDTEYNGAVVVTPDVTIDSSGGNATDDGPGGRGGDIGVVADGGTLRVAGTLRARGGDGDGAGDGGRGGDINMQTYYDDYPNNTPSGGHGMYIGADMDTSGGDGANGGDAGYVSLYTYGQGNGGYAEYGVEPTLLLGYESIDARGGDGTTSGGRGGDTCYLETYSSAYDDNGNYQAASSIRNEAAWDASGGNGGTSSGGLGGSIYFDTDDDNLLPSPPDLTNTGALTSNGGNGASGGSGGYIYLYGVRNLVNEGDITNNGGNGTSTVGGYGGGIDLAGDYSLTNTATLSSAGGSGKGGTGGGGGYIWIASRRTTHEGDLITRGGDSVDGDGGDGGTVEIISTERPSVLSGHLVAAGGESENEDPGDVAEVFIDAINVALDENGELDL